MFELLQSDTTIHESQQISNKPEKLLDEALSLLMTSSDQSSPEISKVDTTQHIDFIDCMFNKEGAESLIPTSDDPVAAALAILGSASIRRAGHDITATLPGERIVSLTDQAVDRIRFRRQVSCRAVNTPTGFSITNIRGISVDPGPLSPVWVPLHGIVVDGDRARISTVGGVSYTVDVDRSELERTLRRAGILPPRR